MHFKISGGACGSVGGVCGKCGSVQECVGLCGSVQECAGTMLRGRDTFFSKNIAPLQSLQEPDF